MQKVGYTIGSVLLVLIIGFCSGYYTCGKTRLEPANNDLQQLLDAQTGFYRIESELRKANTGIEYSLGRITEERNRAEFVASEYSKQRGKDKRRIAELEAIHNVNTELGRQFEDTNREFESILNKYSKLE